ncbi:MAG: methyltransferase, partial [Candidatus Poseidonia sp.]|nr:methyltransferase [Poseidonia sp.]
MRGPHHFKEADAEAEIARLERASQSVSWTSPIGQRFDLDLFPTVYGPREDTNLLAQVINKARLPSQTKALEIGCGAGAISLFAASLGWSVTSCDINPYAVACTKGHAEKYGYPIRVREGGPGPQQDGLPQQWMGDELYDV